MANWSQPALTDTYANFLTYLKDRDLDVAKQFDGVTITNPVAGMIKWNSTSNFWEKYSGSAWAALSSKYMINVDQVDGCTVDDSAAASATVLWTSNKINTFASGYYTKSEIDTLKTNYVVKNGENGTLTLGTNDNSAINLETNNTTRMSIGGSGNVTVSAPTAGVALSVTPYSTQDAISASGPIAGTVLKSTVAIGTAPLSVTSTTKVINLNADKLNGYTWSTTNTVSSIVARDASGNFSAGIITASLTGNASTATTLATARTINGESFNGTANINIEDRLGSAITSASTTTIGTKGLGDTIHITGTTTVTSLGVSNTGTRRTLVFDGVLTLTHNSTSLICPAAADVITVAGTVAEVVCENGASGYWRVLSITHPLVSMAEFGYLDGVTSSIQTQLNDRALLSSPTFTGTPSAPTAATTASSTQLATTAFATPRTATTGAIVVPSGTEVQRPASPIGGYMRFNSDINSFEGYNGTDWASIGGVSEDTSYTAVAQSSAIGVSAGKYWTSMAVGDIGPYSNLVIHLSSSTKVAKSEDLGVSWTTSTPLADQTWSHIIIANNIIIAIPYTGTTYATSTDGTVWTGRILPIADVWNSIQYINNRFILLGHTSSTLLESTDGITWTSRTILDSGATAITYGPSGYVLAHNYTSTVRYTTSTDLISWTNRDLEGLGPYPDVLNITLGVQPIIGSLTYYNGYYYMYKYYGGTDVHALKAAGTIYKTTNPNSAWTPICNINSDDAGAFVIADSILYLKQYTGLMVIEPNDSYYTVLSGLALPDTPYPVPGGLLLSYASTLLATYKITSPAVLMDFAKTASSFSKAWRYGNITTRGGEDVPIIIQRSFNVDTDPLTSRPLPDYNFLIDAENPMLVNSMYVDDLLYRYTWTATTNITANVTTATSFLPTSQYALVVLVGGGGGGGAGISGEGNNKFGGASGEMKWFIVDLLATPNSIQRSTQTAMLKYKVTIGTGGTGGTTTTPDGTSGSSTIFQIYSTDGNTQYANDFIAPGGYAASCAGVGDFYIYGPANAITGRMFSNGSFGTGDNGTTYFAGFGGACTFLARGGNGGNAAATPTAGTAGAANTGAGGGAGALYNTTRSNGGAGGSGKVIIYYSS